ncbi:type II and III secretion system protein family protein [Pseudomonas resinovorans]|uniref:type II and III secretion system protein family protein n=1 Tax=Metapseudomonas resinovorans TaxID=53412 RepID=UPI00237F7554|nr:type II and III secretion system protein family protein [Pseudomonas resinovorans]MDE3737424.1 type II and III secretion system protein family protein [Pseudomonas resinovorans]
MKRWIAPTVFSLLGCAPLAATAAPGCEALGPVPGVVEVGQGHQEVMSYPMAITRLAVGDPEVADVQLADKQSFLITGKRAGATSLMVWTGCSREPRRSLLYVQGVASAALDEALAEPRAADSVPSQVQTDIRFVEVSRGKLKQISASLVREGSNLFILGAPGQLRDISVSMDGTSGGKFTGLDSGFNIIWGGGSSKVLGFINALENSGFAYTLAKPSLVALSGQSASFLAGGEFPIPVPSGDGDNVTVEYKEFGVRLTLTPTVVGSQRISLKVAPEVSELDFSTGINIAGTLVPSLKVRRTDTSVSLADGESFVISGLISSQNVASIDKFPGLGDLPVIGALFRSSQIDREDRELLMIVTPHLVQPLAAGAQLPELPGEGLRRYDPGFFDFYLNESGDFDRRAGLSE